MKSPPDSCFPGASLFVLYVSEERFNEMIDFCREIGSPSRIRTSTMSWRRTLRPHVQFLATQRRPQGIAQPRQDDHLQTGRRRIGNRFRAMKDLVPHERISPTGIGKAVDALFPRIYAADIAQPPAIEHTATTLPLPPISCSTTCSWPLPKIFARGVAVTPCRPCTTQRAMITFVSGNSLGQRVTFMRSCGDPGFQPVRRRISKSFVLYHTHGGNLLSST